MTNVGLRAALASLLLLSFACDDKKPAAPPQPAPAPSPVAVAPPPVAPPPPVVAPPAAPAGDPTFPLSAEVLPSGEATPKTRVVLGDGYRFQVPQDFKRVDHALGKSAYSGTVEGFIAPATMTFWATRAPFAGTLDALEARETKAIVAAKAPKPEAGPVMVQVAGGIKMNYARRLTIKHADRLELRTLVVHGGAAFIHHCETPNAANAWANVGSSCITRGTTFHVAPPALVKKPANARPAAPPTPGVVFMASKVAGTARPKAVVNPWLEDSLAGYLKPCFAKAANGTSWRVAFDLAKDGQAGSSSVTGGPAGTDAPADAATAACVAKEIATAKIDGAAPDSVKVTAVFVIRAD